MIILDRVEYYTRDGGDIALKDNQEFCGIEDRKSDSVTCLSLRSLGKSRRHNIEVGFVIAITIGGARKVVETPVHRWRIRAAEIERLIRFPETTGTGGKQATDKDIGTFAVAAPAHWRVSIEYVDATGYRSRRTILPLKLTYFPSERERRLTPVEITAICEWKKDQRTFFFARIECMFDPETGEERDRLEWFDALFNNFDLIDDNSASFAIQEPTAPKDHAVIWANAPASEIAGARGPPTASAEWAGDTRRVLNSDRPAKVNWVGWWWALGAGVLLLFFYAITHIPWGTDAVSPAATEDTASAQAIATFDPPRHHRKTHRHLPSEPSVDNAASAGDADAASGEAAQ